MRYCLTKSDSYANKAIQMIEKFFINEETKMNPDLTYSGLVFGNNIEDLRIRGATIDTSRLCLLPDLIELLKTNQNWTANIQNSMNSWFEEFITVQNKS